MGEYLNPNQAHLYLLIIFSIMNATLLLFCAYKYLQILQLSMYHCRGVFTWLKESKNRHYTKLIIYSLISFVMVLVVNAILIPFNFGIYISYVAVLGYFGFLLGFILNIKREPLKKPLKYTKRMNRLRIFMWFILAGASFGLFLALIQNNIFRFTLLTLMPFFMLLLVILSNWLMAPLELLINKIYILIASKKLKKYDHLIKIGITGSYGKTSTKYILRTILSEKFNVLITPNSFNTPMGIVKVLRNMLQPNHQIFIAEMGAQYKGDIKYMCNFVKPRYGIITNIGNQHLETFGTLETIKETKGELAEAIPDNGFCVFNLSNFESDDVYNNSNCNKIYIKINDDNAFVTAKNIKVDDDGTTFICKIKGEKEFTVNMKLLGEHNIQNVLEAVAMSYKLGVSINEIKIALAKLKPVKHRLELIHLRNGAVLLDDSFNSNILGMKSAVDVLQKFDQKNKIVITPGLVELGNREMIENLKFGKNISKVATKVYIVNEINKDILTKGLIENGFNEDNIVYVDNFKSAWKMVAENLSKDDVILIENDLPDNYV